MGQQINKYHYVYGISNKLSCIRYIGCRSSSQLPEEDLGKIYFSSSKNKQFLNEQRSHPEMFVYEVLKVFSSRKDAILYEIELHDRYEVGINPDFYNRAKQTSVGFDTTGCCQSKMTILKKRRSLKKFYNHPTKGKLRREKISNAQKGKLLPSSKNICQLDMDSMKIIKIWNSIQHAADGLNLDSSNIAGCLYNKNNLTAGGFRWAFLGEENIPQRSRKLLTGLLSPEAKITYQYDLKTGLFIKEWALVKFAAETLGINPRVISMTMSQNSPAKSAGGFGWSDTKKDFYGIYKNNTGYKHQRKKIKEFYGKEITGTADKTQL